MRNFKSLAIIFAVVMRFTMIVVIIVSTCATLATTSFGQQYKKKGDEVNRNAERSPLAVKEADKKKKLLHKQISAQRGVDTVDWCDSVLNPFTGLTSEGEKKLEARGIDCRRLKKMKAVLLTGSYYGADEKTFINHDPDTILVIGKGFGGHGDVNSIGPILAAEDSHFMGNVTGGTLVWFVEESLPRGEVSGLPVIVAPSVNHNQMEAKSADVWRDDYGWRRPDDFLRIVAKVSSRQSEEGVTSQENGSSGMDEIDQRDKKLEQAKKEIDKLTKESELKPGVEVVVLKNANLMSGTETVGTVRKGQKLTVEDVQDEWLWVQSGQTKGWLDKRNVIYAALMDWYKRLPNDEQVTIGDRMYGNYKDILFEVIGQKGANFFIDNPIQMGAQVASHPVMVIGKNATFVLDRQGPQWLLSVTFMRLSNVFSNDTPVVVNAARRYGLVRPGDFVRIDAKQRRVYVNSERQRPR